MLARRAASATQLKEKISEQLLHFSSSTKPIEEGKSSFVRKAVSFVLITVTGGVALSALDDLAIYHSCSRKAMEKVYTNQAIRDALGEPIEKGPWYNASLAVAHKRHSVSCTFPVSGPQGNGVLQLKAVKNNTDDDGWMSYLRPRDWEILIMEALVHVPENEEKTRTFRITVSDDLPSPPPPPCTTCTHVPSSGEPSTVGT